MCRRQVQGFPHSTTDACSKGQVAGGRLGTGVRRYLRGTYCGDRVPYLHYYILYLIPPPRKFPCRRTRRQSHFTPLLPYYYYYYYDYDCDYYYHYYYHLLTYSPTYSPAYFLTYCLYTVKLPFPFQTNFQFHFDTRSTRTSAHAHIHVHNQIHVEVPSPP